MDNEYLICSECKLKLHEKDCVYVDDKPYCMYCATYCEYCHEWVTDDAQSFAPDKYVCIDCFKTSGEFIYCECCGGWVSKKDTTTYNIENGKIICYVCIENRKNKEKLRRMKWTILKKYSN
jgi:hypothetical protein